MKKLKTQKGITLVALIITIVVLLILAAVAIGAVKNSDIIGYAQNAADSYETEKGKENEAIKDAEDLLNKYANGANVDVEAQFAKFKENPEAFKHPEQDNSKNKNRAVGTDGEAVNMDYWICTIIDKNRKEVALYDDGGSQQYCSYQGGLTEQGTIIGSVPKYIKIDGEEGIYTVTSMAGCFKSTENLKIAPEIPDTVTDTRNMFAYCTNLIQAPTIPSSVTDASWMFSNCTSLTQAPIIPESVMDISFIFEGCTSLTQAPIIPNSVTNASCMFSNCTSLTQAPTIPNSVTDASRMFSNCTSLTQAPIIPESVMDISFIFEGCTSLTGIIRIESANITLQYSPFPAIHTITTIQVPAGSITETTIRNILGSYSSMTLETF